MSRIRDKNAALDQAELLSMVEEKRLAIRVTPNARNNCLFLDKNGSLAARVSVPPEDGKANAATIKLLSKALGIPKSNLSVIRGQTSRNKLIAVNQPDC